MSREDFVTVAVRIFSIYLAISTFRMIGDFVQVSDEIIFLDYVREYIAYILVVIFLPITLSILLWSYAEYVARKILPSSSTENPSMSVDALVLQGVGLTLLGFWMLINSLGDAFYWSSLLYLLNRAGEFDYSASAVEKANIIATVVEFVLGVLLIVKVRGITNIVHRIRYGAK